MCISLGGGGQNITGGQWYEQYLLPEMIRQGFNPKDNSWGNAPPPTPEEIVQSERDALSKRTDDLYTQQNTFQQKQNEFLTQIEQLQTAAQQREAAQFEQLTAAQHASSLPALVQAQGAVDTGGTETSEEGAALDSRRQGRRALRIDLQATGANPLNIPRG